MRIIEVNSRASIKEFLYVPRIIYKDDPNWIIPLEIDIEAVFDKKKNKFFRHGEIIRWILKDDKENLIGRVAAFINRKTAKTFKQPTGGMGFFECVDDKEAAFILFDECKNWLTERGMDAMDGPVNFGERDRWWGLLVDGFTEPNYCVSYNLKYYKELFESYGFKLYFNQYTYARKVKEGGLQESVQEKAERIHKNPSYSFKHIEKKNFEKYAEDLRIIYNKAWVKHGVKGMPKAQAMSILKKIKPIMDEKIIWFAYHNNEPIAFFVNLPELNQIFKHLNGKLNLIGKIKFLYYKKMGACKKMVGAAFGVVPEYQGRGIESAIVIALANYVWEKNAPYVDFEMNWIGDFNPKMMRIAENVGGKIYKTHTTYRKLFDENALFERAPIID